MVASRELVGLAHALAGELEQAKDKRLVLISFLSSMAEYSVEQTGKRSKLMNAIRRYQGSDDPSLLRRYCKQQSKLYPHGENHQLWSLVAQSI